MKLCLFLHLHQPPTQYPEITKKVSRESYQRIFAHLKSFPQAKITVNITGSLAQQLEPDLISEIKALRQQGQIELTQTAAYHPLLVYLPDDEVSRQIKLNREIIRRVFGFEPGPGFFPPEMALDERLISLIKKSGGQWVLADEEAINDPDPKKAVFADPSGFIIVRRNRQLSVAVAFSQIRHLSALLSVAEDQRLKLLILAMDGETFGHHRPEQLEFLKEFLEMSQTKTHPLLTISEMLKGEEPVGTQSVRASSWGSSFDRWRNPQNPVHQLQWQLYELAIKAVQNANLNPSTSSGLTLSEIERVEMQKDNLKFKDLTLNFEPSTLNSSYQNLSELTEKEKSLIRSRDLLDKALHSDQFWWAAKNPCWHYPMLERGARLLLDSIESLPGAVDDERKAKILYDKLIQTAISLYGQTIIAC